MCQIDSDTVCTPKASSIPNLFLVRTFLFQCTRLLSPKLFISISKYLCTAPYGVAGLGEAITTWLTLLPILVIIWVNSCNIDSPPQSLGKNDMTSINIINNDPLLLSGSSDVGELVTTPCIFPKVFRVISLVSPLFIGVLFDTISPFISFIKRCCIIINGRFPSDPSVEKLISSLISRGRMQRTPYYDIYLPPSSLRKKHEISQQSKVEQLPKVSEQISTSPIAGLILIPGYLVPHVSYAPVAQRVSNHGIIVVVLSLEPCRLPLPEMGVNVNNIKQLMSHVSKKVQRIYGKPVHKWNVCGHSAGGYAAMQLFADLALSTPISKSNKEFQMASNASVENDEYSHYSTPTKHKHLERLILWASGARSELLTDLTKVPFSFQMLVLEASEDPIAKFTNDARSALRSRMPTSPGATITHKMIKGGNHGGYAHYTNKGAAFDGIRKISLDTQHDLVSQLTSDFLMT